MYGGTAAVFNYAVFNTHLHYAQQSHSNRMLYIHYCVYNSAFSLAFVCQPLHLKPNKQLVWFRVPFFLLLRSRRPGNSIVSLFYISLSRAWSMRRIWRQIVWALENHSESDDVYNARIWAEFYAQCCLWCVHGFVSVRCVVFLARKIKRNQRRREKTTDRTMI